ncbi:MAG: mechanosensitive ion channel [Desulfuromonadales bacterium]|nr:mechanosensitive ion channel [Desulfuromonadales bacterium]MDW7756094.1 mechanosensitive ion channel [Desulfuromonadales bacterium]
MLKKLLSILILLVCVLSAHAEESTPEEESAVVYPGVAEVVPSLARLQTQTTNALTKTRDLENLSDTKSQIEQLRVRQEKLGRWIKEQGDPAGWNYDRLAETVSKLTAQEVELDRIMSALVEKVAELEKLKEAWKERQIYWRDWQDSLTSSEAKVATESFNNASDLTAEVLQAIEKAMPSLVDRQKEVTALQAASREMRTEIESYMKDFRRQTFSKTGAPFYSRQFYAAFNADLLDAVLAGVHSVKGQATGFWQRQGWVALFQAMLALGLAGFIKRYRRLAEVTQEWHFILDHPWATGVFVSIVSLGFLYTDVPGPYRLGLWALAAFSAAVLTAGLLKNPRKIAMVYSVAILSVLSVALQLISLPSPLYRLYLATIAMVGIPFLLFMAKGNQKVHSGRVNGFTLLLRLGAGVLLVSLVAQIGGFSNLASRLIESSVETIFLYIFTTMSIRLGHGGIDFLFSRPAFRTKLFFIQFGVELQNRLKGLVKVAFLVFAILYLSQIWGLYASAGQAVDQILGYSFTLGEITISVEMILLVAFTVYVSIVVSWFLKAVLEAEIFPRKHYDRGVRDAIKKLLHYSLVLLGFLLALSIAGIELKNLAVVLGAFGIGIGFGLQNIVNNFVSGLILLFERPVKVGDTLVVDDEWGLVKKIGLRSTIVETYNRAEIIVPNSDLISQKVTNWSLSTRVARVVLPVGVAYGSHVEKVLSILGEAARANPDVLSDPEPSPIFTGFGDSSLDFELRVWVEDVGQMLAVKSWLGQYVDKRFREEGVEIPFPQRDLHVRSIDSVVLSSLRENTPSRQDEKNPQETPASGQESLRE